jgi:hypothetical protein
VRKHILPVRVPDAVHARDDLSGRVEHLHLFAHGHKPAAVDLRSDGPEVEPVGVRRPPGGDHDRVDLERVDNLLGLEVRELDQHGLDACRTSEQVGSGEGDVREGHRRRGRERGGEARERDGQASIRKNPEDFNHSEPLKIREEQGSNI